MKKTKTQITSPFIQFFGIAVSSLLLLCLSNCSPKIAGVTLPYDSLSEFSISGDQEMADQWWIAFEDQQLNQVIDTALSANLTLQAIWYQLKEAESLVTIASSTLLPDASFEVQTGVSRPQPDFVGGENTQISLRSNYEVDLWGRIRYAAHAEHYQMKATYFDYKTAAISLSAEIALTWFRIKATKYQLQLVDQQITTNEQVLALIRARFASGQVRGVDILRQRQLIEATRSQEISLELQLEILENQLSVLAGQPPGMTFETDASLPDLPGLPKTGIPLQLVNRRPDVQSAYYELQSADRSLAASISNRYPRLSFSLTGAIRSNTYTDLFQSQAVSIGGSLLAPIFTGGRLKAQVDQADAVRQQRLNDYGQAVLTAFQEVENALVQEQKQLDRIANIEEQVELTERSYGQLRIEYLNGFIPYLDVLVALDQQQELRRSLVTARLNLFETRIGLYRALAGDFELEMEDLQKEG
ncbi:MAG: efflux transporter outer membrane subunit [Cyclobacteriaceae bacterium]